jgi:cbb3-type cytochrome oxidase maturation protein
MSAIYLMLPVSILLAGLFLIAYIWCVRSGQFEDTQTPAMRILPDELTDSKKSSRLESENRI